MWIRSGRAAALALLLVLAAPAVAQERVDLPAPITISQTGWTIASMHLDVDRMRIVVRLRSIGGDVTIEKVYDGPVGDTLLRNLNKANLTTRSLLQRTFDRLIADGVIEGTVTGTPR
jgi:hypothetical protein